MWTGLLILGAAASCPATTIEFNRDIRPILSDNCFACHGPDAGQVKGGLRLDLRDAALGAGKSGRVAIVPGRPDDSELVRRLRTADPDDRMPPPESHKTLTPAQQELLTRWIAGGAEFQGHWAYQPPSRPAAPAGPAAIDHLIGRRLSGIGWEPAPAADRRTLARRLHWDLTGLPPTPAEVEAFVHDALPGAEERLVERLLASPRFGERMAQGWLDVVRFADTIGYHSDNPRNVWPYRDYVIDAFNRNKPFDRFTREQLAGDLLSDATLEARVGSAFNRLLLTTEEGGAQPKDYEARYLTDRVRAVGSVWLGQTIGCAQCHDHKFDPIRQRDFYSLGAFFADIQETIIGRREDGILVPDESQAGRLRELQAAEAALRAELDGPHPGLAADFDRWTALQAAAMDADARWQALGPARAESAAGTSLEVRDDHSVLARGRNPERDTYVLRFTNELSGVVGVRVEALPDGSLPQKGPGRAANGNFVLTEVTARVERPGLAPVPVEFAGAAATVEQEILAEGNPYGRWGAAAVIDGDIHGPGPGWAVLPAAGRPSRLVLRPRDGFDVPPGAVLVVELRQGHGNGGHNLGRLRVAVTTDTALAGAAPAAPPVESVAVLLAVAPSERDAAWRDRLLAEYRVHGPELAGLRTRLADARSARESFEATVARCLVTVRAERPRTVRLLPRGDWMSEDGEVMRPMLPAYLPGADRAPRAGAADLDRLDLAEWILAPENPLTTRVFVNRLWQQFFGSGLSRVLDDLGAQGEPPRHPELLDWLAVEFRESGWDVKHLVRLIVNSGTYRQSSVVPAERLAADPQNREFARQGRWRIDAELVRDTALAVGGLLVERLGGPSVRPYQPDGYWENLNFPPRTYQASTGAGQYRRGVYTWWQRSFVHPSLLAFDAPTREECAAERNRSNIPQQALVLLNDPTYVEAARGLATRALRQPATGDDARLAWAWREVLQRHPDRTETAVLRDLLRRHRDPYRADPSAAAAYVGVGGSPAPSDLDPSELAAWTDVARAVLNLHETITRP